MNGILRRASRQVHVGGVAVGGSAPISVQSMTNTKTEDAEATLEQVRALASRGCDIVRVSVYNAECADAIAAIVAGSPVPIVADIHYDAALAVAAIERGVHKLRINPGNIGSEQNVRRVADCARAHGVPIRIGVNSGSVERALLAKYGSATPEAMVESALGHARLLEKAGFDDIVISVKSTDVAGTVLANRILADRCAYPLHIGITEAGTAETGMVKSAAGIGALLLEGIGDTIRVSLTGSPLPEADAGLAILRTCGMRCDRPTVISCPTCGRTTIPVERIAREVEARISHLRADVKVAVMGCVVNGPGEARQADIGIAGMKGGGAAIFMGDEVIKCAPERAVDELVARVERIAAGGRAE